MTLRRAFIKSMGVLFLPLLLPFARRAGGLKAGCFETIAFISIPTKTKKFPVIKDLLPHSFDADYWRRFQAIKSNFVKSGKLQQSRYCLRDGLFAVRSHFRSTREQMLFSQQIDVRRLKRELEKNNISIHIELLG